MSDRAGVFLPDSTGIRRTGMSALVFLGSRISLYAENVQPSRCFRYQLLSHLAKLINRNFLFAHYQRRAFRGVESRKQKL